MLTSLSTAGMATASTSTTRSTSRSLDLLSDLNDILLDAGLVKPTWMMAYFTKDNRGEFFYRDRRAINSLRTRGKDPRWTRFYPLPEHT